MSATLRALEGLIPRALPALTALFFARVATFAVMRRMPFFPKAATARLARVCVTGRDLALVALCAAAPVVIDGRRLTLKCVALHEPQLQGAASALALFVVLLYSDLSSVALALATLSAVSHASAVSVLLAAATVGTALQLHRGLIAVLVALLLMRVQMCGPETGEVSGGLVLVAIRAFRSPSKRCA